MFKNHNLLSYFWYSALAAIVYCITVFIYVNSQDYRETWWLFIGNALFMIAIIFFLWSFNKTKREDASSPSLVMAGHITTVMGIILSCIISYILLIIYIPGLFQSGETGTTLQNAPATLDTGKTDGLMFTLFMTAIVGNVATGSFASIIFPYTMKRNQTRDSGEIKYRVPQ